MGPVTGHLTFQPLHFELKQKQKCIQHHIKESQSTSRGLLDYSSMYNSAMKVMLFSRNDRSFICPAKDCGKSFYVLQRLKVHMRTHNGEKPFICTELGCGKQFTTAGNLKNHLRIHTGVYHSPFFKFFFCSSIQVLKKFLCISVSQIMSMALTRQLLPLCLYACYEVFI